MRENFIICRKATSISKYMFIIYKVNMKLSIPSSRLSPSTISDLATHCFAGNNTLKRL